MSSILTPTTLGVNNSSPSGTLHATGTTHQLGTLSITNSASSSSTSVRAQIDLNDSTRLMNLLNNGASFAQISSTGNISLPTWGYGLFSVTGGTYTAQSDLNLGSGTLANNISVSGQVMTFVNTGVYRIEVILNQTTGVSGSVNITLYSSSTSGGTYSGGLSFSTGNTAQTGDSTTLHSFLVQVTSSTLYWKFRIWGNTITLDGGGAPDYWSRIQVHQIA